MAYPSFAPARAPRRTRQGGFSLVEVLVAIVVLSIGLVGTVGLQAASLQANKEARNQSTAVRLGRELGELMRGNKDVAQASTANPYLVSNFVANTDTPPSASENCSTTACSTTTAVAQFQISDWLGRVKQELPGARVVVCADGVPYDSSGIPQWACTSGGSDLMVVKIGWTRQSTNRAASGASAVDRASVPGVVLPLIPGAS